MDLGLSTIDELPRIIIRNVYIYILYIICIGYPTGRRNMGRRGGFLYNIIYMYNII